MSERSCPSCGHREVTLHDVLHAREHRVNRQKAMAERYGSPIISFSMNIAGPVKSSPLIDRAFEAGRRRLEHTLLLSFGEGRIQGSDYYDGGGLTGREIIYAVDADADDIKEICTCIEEADEIGRLFDMDVLDVRGHKLSRAAPRPCLICGKRDGSCARGRLHPVSELMDRTRTIIESHVSCENLLAGEESLRISEAVTSALIEEVDTTPKPGLVDINNCGSHHDMTRESFTDSALALRPFWSEFFMAGFLSGGSSPEKDKLFDSLRGIGQRAESAMLEATGGVNTHKGAIFLFGAICAAAGLLWQPNMIPSAEAVAAECAELTGRRLRKELSDILGTAATSSRGGRTAGEASWIDYGMRGIRGELLDGLPSIINTGLPGFCAALSDGLCRNDAGAAVLIELISLGNDTNMVKRGGLALAKEAAEEAASMVRAGNNRDIESILYLDEKYIREGLSPGGCADLLAATYFLHDYSEGLHRSADMVEYKDTKCL